ncbi:copper-fist transcription factor [Phanerochaete sordida]|uniref:Copper-fist transcription factor n=1 Tax=Phanerochaete sordida TaxID=48140 RepID=A0A9P3LKN6_9APHY|nr:copper-fist transcription factor [Phanerochaete sordida]
MVLVADKKYACETCIKGHRSSNCKHVDRPLYEIKKKGRPVTQCEHCRELRKTKQVHVKCVCEIKPSELGGGDAPPPSVVTGTKKASKKVPASAAFPSGLPEALGASVASKTLSESSDSEHELHSSTCTCKTTGTCNCATPRIATSRSKKSSKSPAVADAHDSVPAMAQPAALVVTANSGRNRPVLPRPATSSHNRSSPPRTVQNPTGAHHQRSLAHFSPYERAYEFAHGSDVGLQLPSMPYPQSTVDEYSTLSGRDLNSMPMSPNLDFARNNAPDEFAAFMNSWLATVQPSQPPSDAPAVSCDCGPNCACPGCIIHRGVPATAQGFESCVNPSTCTACMDCTMLTAIDNSPAFEEWFRRMSAADAASHGSPDSLIPGSASPPPSQFSTAPDQQNTPQQYNPSMWQSYALWPNLQNQLSGPPPPEDGVSTCCGGQCKCPPRMCACPADCCGCCAGCACPSCNHKDRSMGSGKTLTFAVSGERAPCCSGGRRSAAPDYNQQVQSSIAEPSPRSRAEVNFSDGRGLDLRGVYEEWNVAGPSTTEVPRVSLSRASSSSSRSSSQHSHRSSSQSFAPSPAARTPDGSVSACCSSMQTLSTSRAGSHHSGSTANSPVPLPFTPSRVQQYPGAPFDIADGSPRIF